MQTRSLLASLPDRDSAPGAVPKFTHRAIKAARGKSAAALCRPTDGLEHQVILHQHPATALDLLTWVIVLARWSVLENLAAVN